MFNCIRIRKLLSTYIDDEVSLKEKTYIETHLQKCSRCQKELVLLKNLSLKLKQWQDIGVSVDFEKNVQEKILGKSFLSKKEANMNKKKLLIGIPLGALATLVIMFLVFMALPYQANLKGKSDTKQSTVAQKHPLQDFKLSMIATTISKDMPIGAAGREGRRVHMAGDSVGSSYQAKQEYLAGEKRDRSDKYSITKTPSLEESLQKLIITAFVNLEVVNSKETYSKVIDITQEVGGYVLESNLYKDESGKESGKITIRVAHDKFIEVFGKLSNLGKVESKNSTSQDVTQEYVDLNARIKNQEAIRDRLLKVLEDRAKKVDEILSVERELGRVTQEIERLKARLEYLGKMAALATITINFHEPIKVLPVVTPSVTNNFKNALLNMRDNFLSVIFDAIAQSGYIIPKVLFFIISLGIFGLALYLAIKLVIHIWKRVKK